MDKNGKKQIDLINDLGYNKSAVSTWCNGTRLPRMDKVEALAKYLGISRSDLMEEHQEPPDSYYLSNKTCEIIQETIYELKLNQLIATRLSYYMEERGVTQNELAEYMNVSQATVSNWCKGIKSPRMDKIDRICLYFNIKHSDLIEERKKEADPYCINDETHEIAQTLHDNPDMRTLFDMGRKMSPERLRVHVDFMKRLYEQEHPEE